MGKQFQKEKKRHTERESEKGMNREEESATEAESTPKHAWKVGRDVKGKVYR